MNDGMGYGMRTWANNGANQWDDLDKSPCIAQLGTVNNVVNGAFSKSQVVDAVEAVIAASDGEGSQCPWGGAVGIEGVEDWFVVVFGLGQKSGGGGGGDALS